MRRFLLVIAMLAPAAPVVALEEAPVAFATSARLVLDGEGRPTRVEPDPKLPPALRAQIAERLSAWRFEAADDQALPAHSVPYARLGVCLVPFARDPDRLELVLDYRGLGPLVEGGLLPPPAYPVNAARAGYSADMEVSYVVQPDGSALLEEIVFLEGGQNAARRRAFERAIRDWVEAMRYAPEQFDGQPVATPVRTPVSFWVGRAGSAEAKRKDREAGQAAAGERAACTAAADEARKTDPVVLQPRLRLVPAGA